MVVAFLAVYLVVDLPRPSQDHLLAKVGRIDFLGAFALVSAVVALLFGLDSGSNNGWSRPVTYVPLALTPVLFAFFIFVEAKVAKNPFAPGHIIFQKALFGAYAANFFGSIPYIISVFYLPLYFQAVMSYSATVSASLLVPAMISAVVASLFGGWIIKRTGKFYAVTIVSYGVLALSTPAVAAAMWFKSTSGAVGFLVVSTFAASCGKSAPTNGCDSVLTRTTGITTTLIGLLANASTEDTAVVVACSYLFRSLGSSIGISASSAVLQQVLRSQLAERFPDGDQAKEIERHVRENLDYIKELPMVLADIVRTCYQISSVSAFTPGVLATVFAFLATFLIKEQPLKGR